MALPQYFQPGQTSTEFYHSVGGDRIYGVLAIDGVDVRYRFDDGSCSYEDLKSFKSQSAAEKFAARFAARMNRSDKKRTVPTLSTFQRFE